MNNITAFDLLSLFATIASLVLAVVAIWLSVFFYRMSNEVSEKTREASKGIAASVDRLEKLFDKLYADTFAMVKDTVSDMRRHIWPEADHNTAAVSEEVQQRTEKRLQALQDEYRQGIAHLLGEQRTTGAQVTSLRSELEKLVTKAISDSKRVYSEAEEEAVRRRILATFEKLVDEGKEPSSGQLFEGSGVSPEAYLKEAMELQKKGILRFAGSPEMRGTVVHRGTTDAHRKQQRPNQSADGDNQGRAEGRP